MKNLHFRWISQQLTDDLRQVKVVECREPHHMLEAMQRTRFHHIVVLKAKRVTIS
jgi:hypothetical protein